MIRFLLGILTSFVAYLLWCNWHSLGFWSGILLSSAFFVTLVLFVLLTLLKKAAPHANKFLNTVFKF